MNKLVSSVNQFPSSIGTIEIVSKLFVVINMNLSLHFNCHFPGKPGLASVY